MIFLKLRLILLIPVVIFSVSALLFYTSFNDPFVFDDDSFIVQNESVHQVQNLSFYFTNSTMASGGASKNAGIYFRPLITLTYSLLWGAGDGDVFPFHFFQWVIFTLSVFLIFLLFRRWFSLEISFFLAMVFLFHPMNSELALYASDLCDSMYLFFGLSSLVFLQYWGEKVLWPTGFFLLIGMLYKETAVLFIPWLLLLARDLYNRRQYLKTIVMMIGVLGTYGFLRIFVADLTSVSHGRAPIAQLPLLERLSSFPRIVTYYLSRFIFPMHSTLQQDWLVQELSFREFWLPLFILIILILLLVFYLKRRKDASSKAFAYVLVAGLVMHSQIISLGGTVSDRWFSFSFIGLLGFLGLMVASVTGYRLIKFMGAVILCISLGFLNWERIQEWESALTLFTIDVERQPDSYLSQNNLGVELFRLGRIEEARQHFQRATELYPGWPTAWNNLGVIYQRINKLEDAKQLYWRAVEGGYYLAFENYAGILAMQNQWQQLLEFLETKALVYYPNNLQLKEFYQLAQSKIKSKN